MRRFNQGDAVVAITLVAGAPRPAAALFASCAGIALVYAAHLEIKLWTLTASSAIESAI